MTVEFTLTTSIAAPIERVFELSLDIDSHIASMAASNERAIAGVTTGHIGLGEEVTWRARHFGIPFTMTSRVTELDRPHHFVDQQVKGPFRRFRHEHEFLASDDVTQVLDRIRFDAPLGFIGRLVERAFLGRYMEKLIEARNGHIRAEASREK